MIAAIAAAVAIARIFRSKQNGHSTYYKDREPAPTATQIVALAQDPRDSDATKIRTLEAQLLLIREDEALKFKEKVVKLAENYTALATLANDISKELSDVILQAGLDRAKVLELDKRVDLMKGINEYEARRRQRSKDGNSNGPPV